MASSPSFLNLSPLIKLRLPKPITAVVIIALLFMSALAQPAMGNVLTSASSGTVVVLGDSISAAYGIQREEGWVYLLDHYLTAKHPGWRVVNASISGETTGGGLARLPGVLDSVAPKIVIL